MKLEIGNLLSLLKSKPAGLNPKEFLELMEQKQKRKAHLRKLLKAMSQEGLIFKDNSRYKLTEKGKAAFVPSSSKSEDAPRGKRTKTEGGKVGFFQNPACLLEVGTGTKLELAPDSEREFLPGDLLGFERAESGQAKVTKFVDRKVEILLGRLRLAEEEMLFDPVSDGYPKGFVLRGLKRDEKLDGKLSLCRIASYPGPRATLKGLVKENDQAAYQEILAANQIEAPFPKAVLEEAKAFGTEVVIGPGRVDLRSKAFVTIDGADAKDFDDAIYAEEEGRGFRLWVAIADVSEYVGLSSALEREAKKRGTSVYLPGTVVPMLPEALSNELCSLKGGLARLTLTAEMGLSPTGEPVDFKVYESVIQTQARLTYTEVDRYFETGAWEKAPHLAQKMIQYRALAKVLRDKRTARGSVNFSLPEVNFEFGPQGEVLAVHQQFQSEAMKLIEQMMLEANEAVGRYCAEHRLPVLWRNHPEPLADKAQRLKDQLWNQNIKISHLETGKDYNKILEQAKDSPARAFIETSLLRSMALAVYGNQRVGHFGLAATHYLHFTSPIRRYPDLVVHRAVKAHLKGESVPKLAHWLGEAASDKERFAKTAERDAVKLKRMGFMARFLGETYEASISGINRQGLFCEVTEPYFEAFLPFALVTDDHYEFDEDLNRAIGRKQKRTLWAGQRLKVLLTGLDLDRRALELAWITWL